MGVRVEPPKRIDLGTRDPWPFVFVAALAALPFVELLAANRDQPLHLPRVALYGGAMVLFLTMILLLVGRREQARTRRAAVLLGVFAWLVFRVPTIDSWWDRLGLDGSDPIEWAIVTAAVFALAIPLSRRPGVQTWAFVVGPALVVVPLAPLGIQPFSSPADASIASHQVMDLTATGDRNVYFFMLDGYASADVIERLTDADIHGFGRALEGRGFDIASHAAANYPLTLLSLGSTFEMDYLADDSAPLVSLDPFTARVRGDNAVRRTFEALGYSYIHAYPGILGGLSCTEVADRCLGGAGNLDETDWALLNRTPLAELVARTTEIEGLALDTDPAAITERVLADDLPPPYFLFAHVLAPHQPNVRAADCSLRAAVEMDLEAPADPETYAGAVTCLNRQLLAAVDRILDADPTAVIVLQGDHGTKFEFSPDQRLPILSAIRMPSGCDFDVPEDLTPVNTFRLVFRCIADPDMPLLPNQHYWVRYDHRDLTDITGGDWRP